MRVGKQNAIVHEEAKSRVRFILLLDVVILNSIDDMYLVMNIFSGH